MNQSERELLSHILINQTQANRPIMHLLEKGALPCILVQVQSFVFVQPYVFAWRNKKHKALKEILSYCFYYRKADFFEITLYLLRSPEGTKFITTYCKKNKISLDSIRSEDDRNLLHGIFWKMFHFSGTQFIKIFKLLLKEGVNLHHLSSERATVLHFGYAHITEKQLQVVFNIIRKRKFNFSKKDRNGTPVYTSLIDRQFPATIIKKVLSEVKGKLTLADFHAVQARRGRKGLLKIVIQKGALDSIPMVEYLKLESPQDYQMLSIALRCFPAIESAMRESSLKSFLDRVFGYHSSSLTTFFLEKQQVLKTEKKGLDLMTLIQAGLLLKNILVSQKNVNYAFDLLKDDAARKMAAQIYQGEVTEVNSVLRSFSPQQIKLLFQNTKMIIDEVHTESEGEITDSELQGLNYCIRSYSNEIVELIKKQKFNNFNNFRKLYDYIDLESTRLSQPNFPFGTLDPKHLAIENLNFGSGLRVCFPKMSYDLIDWGAGLRNCVGNGTFAEKMILGEAVLFGLFKDGKVQYVFQIENEKIMDAKGKFNASVPKALMRQAKKVLIEAEVISS